MKSIVRSERCRNYFLILEVILLNTLKNYDIERTRRNNMGIQNYLIDIGWQDEESYKVYVIKYFLHKLLYAVLHPFIMFL